MTKPFSSVDFIEALHRARLDPQTNLWRAELSQPPYEPLSIAVEFPGPSGGLPAAFIAACASILQRTVSSLHTFRSRIADDLLETYNTNWADDDPDEGPPELSREDFMAELSLADISIYDIEGNRALTFSCGDLFAGHEIVLALDHDDKPVGSASLFG